MKPRQGVVVKKLVLAALFVNLVLLMNSPSLLAGMTVGGDRPVTVYVPSTYDPGVPIPLVLLLHGWSGTGPGTESYMRFQPLAESMGFLYATPTGTEDRAGYPFWNATDACCNIENIAVDDSDYLLRVIDETKAQYKVDERRVYLIGISNGGFMAYRMACDRSDLIAAGVSLAGATFLDPARCSPTSPVHVLQIHGTADDVIFFEGGCWEPESLLPLVAEEPLCFPGAHDSVVQWATYNGCSLEAETEALLDLDPTIEGAETEITRYVNGCAPGGSTELWTMTGRDHGFRATFQNSGEFAARIIRWLFDHAKSPVPKASFTVTPEGGEDPLQVEVDARGSTTPEGTSILAFDWDFGDGDTGNGAVAKHTYDEAGNYTISLTVRTDDGGRIDTTFRDLQVVLREGPILPWESAYVEDPDRSNRARFEDDCLLVSGGGGNISGVRDRFHFVYQKVNDAFRLTAQISDWNAELGAIVGLMVRESLDPGARHGSVVVRLLRTGLRHEFRRRDVADESTKFAIGSTYGNVNLWLRIERRGDSVRGMLSEDGVSWTDPDEIDLEGFPTDVYVGVASSAGAGAPSVATICELSITLPHFLRGDCNGDGAFDISDGVSNLNSLFGDGKPSNCTEACNANDDAQNDVSDAVYVFNFLFGSGEPPAAPYPACGEDPEPAASLGCGRFGCE